MPAHPVIIAGDPHGDCGRPRVVVDLAGHKATNSQNDAASLNFEG